MDCPVCGTPLGDSQIRCSDCGYSFSEPLDLGADVTPPGDRPHEVVLAVKLLAVSLRVNLIIVLLVFASVGIFRLMPAWAIWLTFGAIALKCLFIALMWWGVRWARILFLILLGCRLAGSLFGMSLSLSSLSLDTAIDLFVAYLLPQPESRNWFYGRGVTV